MKLIEAQDVEINHPTSRKP